MVYSQPVSYWLNNPTTFPSPKELHAFTKELYSRQRGGCIFGLAQNRFVKRSCNMQKCFLSNEMVRSRHASYCLNSSTTFPSTKKLYAFTRGRSLVARYDFASLEQYETVWKNAVCHKSFLSNEMVHSKLFSYWPNYSTTSPSAKELHAFTMELFGRQRGGCIFGLGLNRFVKIVCSMAKTFS